MRGTFTDPLGRLPSHKGKTAMIIEAEQAGIVLAQFDDTTLPEAFGWHPFLASDFEIIPLSELV